jgi:membrane protein
MPSTWGRRASRALTAASGTVDGVATFLGRLDAWQQRRRVIGFLVAIVVRYREDRGRQFGALLSYYGFVSLFPLLLVLVTILGIVLDGHADLRARILDTVYARIPIVGAQLKTSTSSLEANGWALAFGLVVAIWAGLAVVKHAQDALNLQWSLPWYRRPRFVERNGRALGALVVVGLGIVLATLVTGLTAYLPELAGGGRILGASVAITLNVLVLTASFRVLVKGAIDWHALVPGGAVGGVSLWVLQLVGAEYVARVVLDASEVYGTFAVMFGLLAWIALLARVVLLANEVNVVRARRLWPRRLLDTTPPSDGDRRAAAESRRREALFAEAAAIAQADESTGSAASSSRTRGMTSRP